MSSISRRLALHLPMDLLREVIDALVRGKIGCACLVLQPRLRNSDPVNMLMFQLQIGINSVARATIGERKSDC